MLTFIFNYFQQKKNVLIFQKFAKVIKNKNYQCLKKYLLLEERVL